MNLDQLRATIEQNKKGLAIAGAAAVAGLALLNKRNAAPASPAAPPAPTSGSQYGLAPLPATGAAGVYDSSSSDVYNAIQPQLEDLGQKQSQLDAMLTKLTGSPIPVAAPPTPGFYRNVKTHGIYQVDAAGTRDWLDLDEYLALGTPEVIQTANDSQVWTTTKLVGDDYSSPRFLTQ